MALTPSLEGRSGLWVVLEVALPATPPLVEGAVALEGTGVPALPCAPSPTRVAGVLGLMGGVCCCGAVCAMRVVKDRTNPKLMTLRRILMKSLH